MTVGRQLGSPSALSLATNVITSPEALPIAIAVAGVTATVAAAVFIYRRFESYQKKKHEKEIEKVNSRYKKYLARIIIPGIGEIKGFPPIFKVSEDKSSAELMHFTEEQIDDMGTSMPQGANMALAMYRECIKNAILKLKEYYSLRGKKIKNNISAGVLCYLMYMLEDKFLNFQGYDYDIAYLSAFINFMGSYASLKNHTATSRFTHLMIAASYLSEAKQYLEKHKDSLSLQDNISELKDTCVKESEILIRKFIRLIMPDRCWVGFFRKIDVVKLSNTVALDELAKGILSREYVKFGIGDRAVINDPVIELPECIYKDWVKIMTGYYIQTLNPDTDLKVEDILSPQQIFAVPDLQLLLYLQHKRSINKEESRKIKKLLYDLKNIEMIFRHNKNFITTKVLQSERQLKRALKKFVSIYIAKELVERSKILADICTLIHQVISLQYLCACLLKSLKQLGEIYVKNPNHFCKIFAVLDALCQLIKKNAEKNKRSILRIRADNGHAYQLEQQEVFPLQFISELDAIITTISIFGDRIAVYRKNAAINLNSSSAITEESIKQEIFEVAETFAKIYRIKLNKSLDKDSVNTNSHTEVNHGEEPLALVRGPADVMELPDEQSEVSFSYSPLWNSGDPQDKLEALDLIMQQIFSSLLSIQQHEEPANKSVKEMAIFINEMHAYNDLQNAMRDMQDKAVAMVYEKRKSKERQNKINKTLDISLRLFKSVDAFFKYPKNDRLNNVNALSQSVHTVIDENKEVIDQSYGFSGFVNKVFGVSLYRTGTRKKFTKISYICDKLKRMSSV